MKKKIFYELVSENLTNLGGPMGMEYTFDNWRKSFSSLEKAKSYAEKDYKYQKERPISWQQQNDRWCSGDLSFVMYTIKEVEIL